MLQTFKNKIIYLPLVLYPVVYAFSWFLFNRDFDVTVPPPSLREGSTHFLFVLTDRTTKAAYLVKHRNPFGDIYFRRHSGVTRLKRSRYNELIQTVTAKPYMQAFMPAVRIYKGRVLWEYVASAHELDSQKLGLSMEERRAIWAQVEHALTKLYEDGIIYGRMKRKHILVDREETKQRIIVIDWDTARYR